MMSDDIKVICKKCGRPSKASEFVLDPDYKMMVCLQCSKERKSSFGKKPSSLNPNQREDSAINNTKRPAGWDEDDEMLEKAARRMATKTEPPKTQYELIDDENIKLTCPKCEYRFTYNTIRMTPNSCPYCGVKLNIKIR